jgi:endonuclease YncB( thermonuclease family)
MRVASLALVLIVLLPGAVTAQDFAGVVIKVADGDSLTVLTPEKREIEVRLADIDAPERGQPFANQARQALRDLALQKYVVVRFNDTDTYGRIVGRLYVGNIDISAEMIRRGLAWVYRFYARDSGLLELEDQARTARRGLWAASEAPVPPWEWRRGNQSPTQILPEVPPADFSCQTQKSACRQMTTCEEARFYLTQCGIRSIDGDNDGVPCEAICPGG